MDHNPRRKVVRRDDSFHNGGAQPSQLAHAIEMETSLEEIHCSADPFTWRSLVVGVVWGSPAIESSWISRGPHRPFPICRRQCVVDRAGGRSGSGCSAKELANSYIRPHCIVLRETAALEGSSGLG